jgi:ribose-phosphate pyrophosphokinase
MDLHAPQIQGFFDIPVYHLLGVPILAPYFCKKFPDTENTVIVSPDLGSVSRARRFAEKYEAAIAIVDKRRPRANVSEVVNIIGDVKGKTVIIVDDMVDTAGTLVGAATALVERGGAKEVYACATHGLFNGEALERIENSPIKEIVVLDTIPIPQEKRIDKITVLPVAPVFADAIERIYGDKPVSPLFV